MSTTAHSPIQNYLDALHRDIAALTGGAVASYIPELARVDRSGFGICIATVDGHVYEVGDTRREFTIQSISKAICYGLALEDIGVDNVLKKVDVEPSGEAFNSISLHPVTGRPRNPMINAGAIATCDAVQGSDPAHRLQRLLQTFERYVGRQLTIDEKVYRSEKDTGHRNRALAHLMYGFGILTQPPETALDLYFQQCSINVDCRDLAMIGACLANAGVNPVTGETALRRDHVPKVLSVMSSCGMYDASGTWLFNVGMPAKSGVGGGIVAVLPGQIGIGVYSPALDERGNSVRGVAVCEAISRDFNLHLFQSIRSTSSAVVRTSYSVSDITSRRSRHRDEEVLLQQHGTTIRIFQLQGELLFGSVESLLHQLVANLPSVDYFVIDLKHVSHISQAAARLFADFIRLVRSQAKELLFTDTHDRPALRAMLADRFSVEEAGALFDCQDCDRAVQWCEDRLLRSHVRREVSVSLDHVMQLHEHPFAAGLSAAQLGYLQHRSHRVSFSAGETVVRAGDEAASMFLIVAGEVEVLLKLGSATERRLASLGAGATFGEMALVNQDRRTADIRAVSPTICHEIAFAALDDALRSRLLVNLAQQLSRKLLGQEREMKVLGG